MYKARLDLIFLSPYRPGLGGGAEFRTAFDRECITEITSAFALKLRTDQHIPALRAGDAPQLAAASEHAAKLQTLKRLTEELAELASC